MADSRVWWLVLLLGAGLFPSAGAIDGGEAYYWMGVCAVDPAILGTHKLATRVVLERDQIQHPVGTLYYWVGGRLLDDSFLMVALNVDNPLGVAELVVAEAEYWPQGRGPVQTSFLNLPRDHFPGGRAYWLNLSASPDGTWVPSIEGIPFGSFQAEVDGFSSRVFVNAENANGGPVAEMRAALFSPAFVYEDASGAEREAQHAKACYQRQGSGQDCALLPRATIPYAAESVGFNQVLIGRTPGCVPNGQPLW